MAEQARKRSAVEDVGLSAARRRAILHERTQRLAARDQEASQAAPGERVFLCNVGSNLYGLPIGEVAKVKPFGRWGAAKGHGALLGLVSDEGEILPVLDMATLLGAPAGEGTRGGWLIRLAPPHKAALRVASLPAAAEVERLGDDGRARALDGDQADKLLVMISARELLDLAQASSQPHGAPAP